MSVHMHVWKLVKGLPNYLQIRTTSVVCVCVWSLVSTKGAVARITVQYITIDVRNFVIVRKPTVHRSMSRMACIFPTKTYGSLVPKRYQCPSTIWIQCRDNPTRWGCWDDILNTIIIPVVTVYNNDIYNAKMPPPPQSFNRWFVRKVCEMGVLRLLYYNYITTQQWWLQYSYFKHSLFLTSYFYCCGSWCMFL